MIAKNIVISEDSQEFIKPILPGLPISVFYTSFQENTYNCINWHWHEAFQYCLITEGAVDFLLPNTTHHVKEGDGIFINIQQIHFSKGHSSSPSSYLCLDVPPSFICSDERSRIWQKYIKPVVRSPYPPALLLSRRDPCQKEILESIRRIQALLKDGEEFIELDILMLAASIWKNTFRQISQISPPPPEEDNRDNDRLKIIMQYMLDHYSEKITLEDIANQISVSSGECCRFFKKATGQSMFSYLKNLRVNKSMDLLKNPDMSLSEIANAVGFCNQSYYTDCFRKSKNITPKKYRELTLRRPKDILPLDMSS